MDSCPFQMSARAHLYMVAVIYFLLSGEKWIEKLSVKPANCILAYPSWLWQDFHLPCRWHGKIGGSRMKTHLFFVAHFSFLLCSFIYTFISFRSRVDVECRKKWHVERNWSWKELVTYPRLYYSFLSISKSMSSSSQSSKSSASNYMHGLTFWIWIMQGEIPRIKRRKKLKEKLDFFINFRLKHHLAKFCGISRMSNRAKSKISSESLVKEFSFPFHGNWTELKWGMSSRCCLSPSVTLTSQFLVRLFWHSK